MFTKLSLYGILTFLSTTSAFALTCANNYGGTTSCVNNTQTAGDCTSLGYSKDGCDHFLYCPFDKAYKKCVSGSSLSAYDIPCSQLGFTQENKTDWCSQIISCPQDSSYTLCAQTKYAKDCSDYPLYKCPEGATGCSSCSDGVKISYRINGCKEGYSPNGISCSINNCTDYTLKKCPTGAAQCSSCKKGTETLYKVDACMEGYVMNKNTCQEKNCFALDHRLASCPTDGICSTCQQGSNVRYKLLFCTDGKEPSVTGNRCH